MAEQPTLEPVEQTPPVEPTENSNTTPVVVESNEEIPSWEENTATASFEAALKKKDEEAAKASATPKQEEPKADAPKPEESAPKPEDVIPDDELQPLPHDKPKTQARIKTLHGKWRSAEEKAAQLEKEKQERDARIKELEEKSKLTPNGNAELEQLKKEREEALAKAKEMEEKYLPYRRQYEVETAPEIEEKFVKPSKMAEKEIASTLKNYGFSDGTIAEIEKNGGLAAFSKSQKAYRLRDADGGVTEMTAAEWVRDEISKMDLADAERIRSLIGEQQRLEIQRKAFIESERTKAKEYFEGLTKAQQEEQKRFQEAQANAVKQVQDWLAETYSKDDDLKDVEGDEKAARAEARETLAKILSPNNDTATLLEAAKMSAKAPLIIKRLAAKDAEIATLKKAIADKEAELDKVRGAGSAVPRTSGRLGTPAQQGKKLDADSEAIMRGKSSAELMAERMGITEY
jgi:hypothetical protein